LERQDQEKMIIGQRDKEKDQHWDKQRLERPKERISLGQTGLTEDHQRIGQTKERNSPGQTGLTEDFSK
jgi:hypothetical protein